jgi:hypothetical protein
MATSTPQNMLITHYRPFDEEETPLARILSLSNIVAKLQLMYYQYSVTLPLYGMEPWENAILNTIVIILALLILQTLYYIFRIIFYLLHCLLAVSLALMWLAQRRGWGSIGGRRGEEEYSSRGGDSVYLIMDRP